MAAGDSARVLRAPGRIVIAPTKPFHGNVYPFGGREVGKVNACVLKPLGTRFHVESEGLGETTDILDSGSNWMFACFLRGWDDDALSLFRPESFEAGDVTQHAVVTVPGNKAAGASVLGNAVVLAYVPEDTVRVPGVILYRAVPDWTDGSELAFRRGSELGLPLTFSCVRDVDGRILQVGRLADLEL